jgi:hypothetical protein
VNAWNLVFVFPGSHREFHNYRPSELAVIKTSNTERRKVEKIMVFFFNLILFWHCLTTASWFPLQIFFQNFLSQYSDLAEYIINKTTSCVCFSLFYLLLLTLPSHFRTPVHEWTSASAVQKECPHWRISTSDSIGTWLNAFLYFFTPFFFSFPDGVLLCSSGQS